MAVRSSNCCTSFSYVFVGTPSSEPFQGIVSKRTVNAGDVVSPGTELFTIIDPSSMRLEASVPSEDLRALRVGATVEFTVRGYDTPFQGRIERIAPQADATTRQVPIYVAIPNVGGRLVAGLFAEGRVVSQSASGIVVPVNAVNTTDASKPWVLRVTDGKTERVNVTLGLRDPRTERVQVASGLNEGDVLLRGASQGITPGYPGEGEYDEVMAESDMFISDTAIKRPVLTVVAMLMLVVFGIVALLQLDTDEYPEIDAPVVVVAIPYPGASPDVVEREVVDPIEEAISGISGIDRMRSNSLDSFANIIVEFDFSKDPQVATQEIRDKISEIRNDLPTEMEEPILTQFDPADRPIVSLTLSSPG